MVCRRTLPVVMVVLASFFMICNANTEECTEEYMVNKKECMQKEDVVAGKEQTHVHKIVLDNGLTVLVYPSKIIPKVSIQMWYNVGSIDEKLHEKGIAHLIEHMIFKGTAGKGSLNMSEVDMDTIMHTISAGCNAFTSYDYTGFVCNVPKHNCLLVLPIMADCMQNCAFDDQLLNSELKAVIQELKMYHDHPMRSLSEELLAAIFGGHPYHNPIVGYKDVLWDLHGEDLRTFYKQHYAPNNATLVMVGDIDPDEAFAMAKKHFGSIPAADIAERKVIAYVPDISEKRVTVYRDIQQPIALECFVAPGARTGNDDYFEVISWLLARGRGSRLHRILVDEKQLATSVGIMYEDLFEHGLLCVAFEPKNAEDIPTIRKIITQEIESIIQKGFKKGELERAVKNAKVRMYDTFEDLEQQAAEIGKYYLATGDPDYIFTYLDEPIETIKKEVESLLRAYCRPAVMHEGVVLPLSESEKQEWLALQEASDAQDKKMFATRVRTTPLEEPFYAKQITANDIGVFHFPHAEKMELANGLELLYYNNPTIPKVNLVFEFKSKYYYDSEDKQGSCNFMNSMLMEGTKNYTAEQLSDALESRGMQLVPYPGGLVMSMLKEDVQDGLAILNEVLTNATFPAEKMEKVRAQIFADIKRLWDNPMAIAGQLAKDIVYKDHAYSKDVLGTAETVASITRDDLMNLYKKYMTPQGTRVAIVGDIAGIDIPCIMKKKLGEWEGPKVAEIDFSALKPVEAQEVLYEINRDQVVLLLSGLSIKRTDKDFDALLLFDQIFGSGLIGSMKSRLFNIRQQTGLFYAIDGSVLARADEQPGMVVIKAITSLDRLQEALKRINEVVDTVADSIDAEEVAEAKRSIANAIINKFESNLSIAQSFLYLARFGLADDYFDKRAVSLEPITVDQIKQAVKKVLASNKLATLLVGRVSKQGTEK